MAGLWLQLKLDAGDIGGLSEDGIPSLSTLWKVAHDAESEWAKKRDKGFGKAKARLFTFLDTMDAHKYLFSIIPNGDKYTSLLTGSLTSIVKVGRLICIPSSIVTRECVSSKCFIGFCKP